VIIVDSIKLLDQYREDITSSDIILIPIYSDVNKHYTHNRISLLYTYVINSNTTYIIPLNHTDTTNIPIDINEVYNLPTKIYVLNKKRFKHHLVNSDKCLDIGLIHYYKNNKNISEESLITNTHQFYYRKYPTILNVNDIVPLTKHIESCEFIVDMVNLLLFDFDETESFKYYNNVYIDSLYNIEKEGIYVTDNFEGATKYKPTNNLVYSEYNIYTVTGRPSNSYNGVNFAGLNKESGIRSHFVSRHPKGFLVSFDYDAYHLQLIAELIGYKFPEGVGIHEYLGKQYFNTDTLTPEQYSNSKTISFRQLYGGVQQEYKHIPFFEKTTTFINNVWQDFQFDGKTHTFIFNRPLLWNFYDDDLTKHRLFNYLLQSLETERNMIIISDVCKYLQDKQTKLVLYTYDSFLLDFSINDGKDVLIDIKKILQKGGFPTSIDIGSNYNDMKHVKF